MPCKFLFSIIVTTEKTTAYTFADTLQTNITVSDDQTTHYTQKVETGNIVSTQQVKTNNLTTQRVKTNSILTTQGVTTSYILTTQGVNASNILPTQGVKTSNILTTQRVNTGNILTTQGVKTSNILTTQGVKTSNILTTQRVNTDNEASTPLTTSTEHTENSMTTFRPNGYVSTLSDENVRTAGFIEMISNISVLGCNPPIWPGICSICLKHFPVLSSFITYHRVCNLRNTTDATSGAGIAYPSAAPDFTPGF